MKARHKYQLDMVIEFDGMSEAQAAKIVGQAIHEALDAALNDEVEEARYNAKKGDAELSTNIPKAKLLTKPKKAPAKKKPAKKATKHKKTASKKAKTVSVSVTKPKTPESDKATLSFIRRMFG